VADVRTIADCTLQRSVCNCNKDIIIIIIIIIVIIIIGVVFNRNVLFTAVDVRI